MEISKMVQAVIRQNPANQKNNTPAVGQAAQAGQPPRTDLLRISEAAREAAAQKLQVLEQLQAGNEQAVSASDQLEVKLNCILIALRVMNGDHVPLKDLQYLQKNDPEMYAQAIMLRRKNENPKEHKSVLKDKDRQDQPTPNLESRIGDAREALQQAVQKLTAQTE